MRAILLFIVLVFETTFAFADGQDLTVFTEKVSSGTSKGRNFIVNANPAATWIDESNVRIWYLSSFDKCTKFPCSAIELFEYHCANKTQRLLSAYNYADSMIKGDAQRIKDNIEIPDDVESIETTTPAEARIKYVIPGTVGETMLKHACNKK